MPARANPLFSITRPSVMTIRALAFNTCPANFLLSIGWTAPNRKSIGTVPREKTSMERAPWTILPVPSAYSCIICKGPQGIKALSMPTEKGPRPEAPFRITLNANEGMLKLNLRKTLNNPNRLNPIIIMNRPPMRGMIPRQIPGNWKTWPIPPASPPKSV
ncbi:hypothetical protein D3C71_1377760 [compost metagenome]